MAWSPHSQWAYKHGTSITQMSVMVHETTHLTDACERNDALENYRSGTLVRPLRNTGQSYDRRLNEFIKAKSNFDRAYAALYEDMSIVIVEVTEKDKAEAIVAADKRLGFLLPPEFKSLLTEAGQLSIGDSSRLPESVLFSNHP